MYICKRVLHSGLKALVYAWMAAHLWKILIFKMCPVFPQMSKVFSSYFWRCPSFPEKYQSPSNTSQQDFICYDFSLHSCVPLNVLTSCAYIWNSPAALYATHTMILIAFQDVRLVILTVSGNIAFFSSLSSILIFWHILRTCVVGFLFLISYKIKYIYIYTAFISESINGERRFGMPKLWR
jgi:hypothetical protein